MFCDACGTQLRTEERFCHACGKAQGTIPLMPVRSRIAGHIRLLGILWLAVSAFRLIPAVVLINFRRWGFPPGGPEFVPHLLGFIGTAILASAVVGLIAGWGLLERAPWARMLAVVVGCFNLVDMPFGTALGIYTLWVLLPAASEEDYRRMAKVA